MSHYVVLGNFTDQGIRTVKDTGKRARGLRDLAKGMGVTVKDVYWTIGVYDVVFTMQAPTDEAAASFMMKLGSLGNIKSQTLRAFNETEIEAITAKF